MMCLFIALALFVVEELTPKTISSNTFFMVGIRSAIAPAVCVSIFSNWIYRAQWDGMGLLVRYMSLADPQFFSRFSQSCVVSAFIPFHKTVKVKILRGGDDMV